MDIIKKEGQVRSWNAQRGFGTISYAENGILKHAWFSFSCTVKVVKRNEDIPQGTSVLFTLDPLPPIGGRLPIARNVEFIASGIFNNGGAR